MADLCLYYAPDNASLCIRLALEELGCTYDTHLVDRSTKAQKSDAYKAVNPNGLIPTLQTPDGMIFETGAILLWLGDTYGQVENRAETLKWLFWLSNTLHPSLRMLFYPGQYYDGAPEDLRRKTRQNLIGHYTLLEQHADWVANDFSILSSYLLPLLRWPALYGGATDWYDLRHYPRLYQHAQRSEKRPATQRATSAEALGTTPFSNPGKPPQGSVGNGAKAL